MKAEPTNKIGWCNITVNPDPRACRYLACELRNIDGKNWCYACQQWNRFKRDTEFSIEYAESQFRKLEGLPPTTVMMPSMTELGTLERDILQAIVDMTATYPEHRFILLTKIPHVFKGIELTENIMLGTSVTSQRTSFRIDELLTAAPDNQKCVSFEPLLKGMIPYVLRNLLCDIDLIMIGALSWNNRPSLEYYPKLSWIDEIKSAFWEANPKGKVWMKENLLIQQKVKGYG